MPRTVLYSGAGYVGLSGYVENFARRFFHLQPPAIFQTAAKRGAQRPGLPGRRGDGSNKPLRPPRTQNPSLAVCLRVAEPIFREVTRRPGEFRLADEGRERAMLRRGGKQLLFEGAVGVRMALIRQPPF
jgi:hypothetical protein